MFLILCPSSALSCSSFVTQRKVFETALIFERRILSALGLSGSWRAMKLLLAKKCSQDSILQKT